MKVDVILGLQWGDEGKGKIVDVLTPRYDIIARFQGGPNAGHTIEFDGRRFVLHTIPSGIFHPETVNVIGNGVIIDPFIMMNEVAALREAGHPVDRNLRISGRAHLILPTHRVLDGLYEKAKGDAKIGSTLKGIGPAYTDKYARNGIRAGDLLSAGFQEKYRNRKEDHLRIIETAGFDLSGYRIDGLTFEEYEKLWIAASNEITSFRIINSEYFLNRSLEEGKTILAEGAQGTLLDVDFGSYPFVTSSNTVTGGACTGLGVPPKRIGTVYGIFKAYCTRVGSGPFPTELKDETGETLRQRGHEFGSTTGRPRRCGWLDLPALKYAVMINGVNSLVMMKADVMSSLERIRICTDYRIDGKVQDRFPMDPGDGVAEPVYTEVDGWFQDFTNIRSVNQVPKQLASYITYIENALGIPVGMISVGPDRSQTLDRSML